MDGFQSVFDVNGIEKANSVRMYNMAKNQIIPNI